MNTIHGWQALVGEVNAANGWHEGTATPVERLALITCEVSEAIEEVRDGHCVDEAYYNGTKPEGVPAELADVVIRCLDFADFYGIDLEAAIVEKVAYNRTRGYRHRWKVL